MEDIKIKNDDYADVMALHEEMREYHKKLLKVMDEVKYYKIKHEAAKAEFWRFLQKKYPMLRQEYDTIWNFEEKTMSIKGNPKFQNPLAFPFNKEEWE